MEAGIDGAVRGRAERRRQGRAVTATGPTWQRRRWSASCFSPRARAAAASACDMRSKMMHVRRAHLVSNRRRRRKKKKKRARWIDRSIQPVASHDDYVNRLVIARIAISRDHSTHTNILRVDPQIIHHTHVRTDRMMASGEDFLQGKKRT